MILTTKDKIWVLMLYMELLQQEEEGVTQEMVTGVMEMMEVLKDQQMDLL